MDIYFDFGFGKIRMGQEPAIEIERTEEFHRRAEELSGFIAALPISKQENDALIALIIQQIQASEQGAFKQGFEMGAKAANT